MNHPFIFPRYFLVVWFSNILFFANTELWKHFRQVHKCCGRKVDVTHMVTHYGKTEHSSKTGGSWTASEMSLSDSSKQTVVFQDVPFKLFNKKGTKNHAALRIVATLVGHRHVA